MFGAAPRDISLFGLGPNNLGGLSSRIHLARWKLFRSNVKWIIAQLSSCCKGAESSFLSISTIGYRTLSQDVIQVGKSRFVDLRDEGRELLLKFEGRQGNLQLRQQALTEILNVGPSASHCFPHRIGL